LLIDEWDTVNQTFTSAQMAQVELQGGQKTKDNYLELINHAN